VGKARTHSTLRQPLPRYSSAMESLAHLVDPDAIAAAKALLTPANIATAIIAMNFLAFAAFGIDKARAEQGAWRISVGTLLLLAFFGGTLGAYAGRAMFRHKTRKQPFSSNLHAIAALQFLGVAALVAYIWFGEELALLLNT
jgi:uncharacterized membrane protein YsdA (DUF1294 family)